MPYVLSVFLGSLVKVGQYIPNNFLSQFEMNKLNLDELGGIISSSYPQKMLMIGGFILIKVLVCRIIATQNIQALSQQLSSQTNPSSGNGPKFNLKILSRIFYYIVVEYMETLLNTKGYSEDLIWTCGLKSILYRHTELKMFYSNENYRVRCEHFALLEQFFKGLNQKLGSPSSVPAS